MKIYIEASELPNSEHDLEPWLTALDTAVKRLAEDEPEFNWWAAIGSREAMISDVPKVVESATLGNITIESAKNPYTEGLDGLENPHMSGANIVSSFPLVVRGRSRGYNWDAALDRATRDLNTICALLSVELDCHWRIRSQPHIDEGRAIELPSWGYGLSDSEHHIPVLGSMREVRIPSWFERAFALVGEDEILYAAIHSHREGLALVDEHPSLSLICFISAIEGIGAKFEDLQKCEYCNSHTGAGRRFRKALKTVYSNKQMKDLVTAYELRSQTAHAGILHGNETHMGSVRIPFTMFAGRPPSMDFRFNTLWSMRDASKRVLVGQFAE